MMDHIMGLTRVRAQMWDPYVHDVEVSINWEVLQRGHTGFLQSDFRLLLGLI